MAKWRKKINEFTIVYNINPDLNVNKAFIEQVENLMYNTSGEITKSFIKATSSKNNTSVLACWNTIPQKDLLLCNAMVIICENFQMM